MSANNPTIEERKLEKLKRDAQELINLLRHIDPEIGESINIEQYANQHKEALEKAQGLLLNMALQGDFNTNLEAFILAGVNSDDFEKLQILLNYSKKIFSVHNSEFQSLSLAIIAAVNPQIKKIALEEQSIQELISLLKHTDPEMSVEQYKKALEQAQDLLLEMALQENFKTDLEPLTLAIAQIKKYEKDLKKKYNDPKMRLGQYKQALREAKGLLLEMALQESFNPNLEPLILAIAQVKKYKEALENAQKAQDLLLKMALREDFKTNLEPLILARFNNGDFDRLKTLLERERSQDEIVYAHESFVKPRFLAIAQKRLLAIAQEELDEAIAAREISAIPAFAKSGIEASETIVTAVDSDGKTALHHAVEQGDLEAVNWLLKAGFSFALMKDKGEKTALDYAAQTDNYKILFVIYVGLNQEDREKAGAELLIAKYKDSLKRGKQEKEIDKLFIAGIELISSVKERAMRDKKLIRLCLELSAKTRRSDDEQLLFDGLLSELKASNSNLEKYEEYQYLINRGFVIEKRNQQNIGRDTRKAWTDLDVAMGAFDGCLIRENISVDERQEACKAANERLAIIFPANANKQGETNAKQDNFKAKIEYKSNKKIRAILKIIGSAAMVVFGCLLAPTVILSAPLVLGGKNLFKKYKRQYDEACNAEAIKKPFEDLSRLVPQDEVGVDNAQLVKLREDIKSKVTKIANETILKEIIASETDAKRVAAELAAGNVFADLKEKRPVADIEHKKRIAKKLTESYFQNLLAQKQGLFDVDQYKLVFEAHITASKYPDSKNDIEELYRLLDTLRGRETANLLLPKAQVPVQEKHETEIVMEQNISNPVGPYSMSPKIDEKGKEEVVASKHSTNGGGSLTESLKKELKASKKAVDSLPPPPTSSVQYTFRLDESILGKQSTQNSYAKGTEMKKPNYSGNRFSFLYGSSSTQNSCANNEAQLQLIIGGAIPTT